MSINVELARSNMVESQVRTWDVLDPRVLETLANVPRDQFVPAEYRAMAYADLALPLAHGESMLKPVIVGRILQALLLQPDESVLEIGTGSGYLTACMAELSRHVASVEQHADLAENARRNLQHAGIGNVRIDVAEAVNGFASQEQFDVVVVTAAVWQLPASLLRHVRPGGRLIAAVGESPVQVLELHRRDANGGWVVDAVLETDLPYLNHAQPPRRFTL